jgi:hypothetical protein
MANVFLNLKNPFVGFASPFCFWSPGCENSPPKKKKTVVKMGCSEIEEFAYFPGPFFPPKIRDLGTSKLGKD